MSMFDRTATDALHSLNAYEENWITEAFGRGIFDLAETDSANYVRALAYACWRREEGVSKSEAKDRAMLLRIGELEDVFLDEDAEPMPDMPVTDAGKGDSQSD